MSETDTPQFGRAMTLEEWADLDEDQEGELVDGRLEEEEMTSTGHEVVVTWLIVQLSRWLEPRGGWALGSQHKMAVAPRRGRIPDAVVYLPGTRLPTSLARRPPDIVIEVVSSRPRDARRDRVDKKADYASFGVRYYWIVDPGLRSFEVNQLGAEGRYLDALTVSSGTHPIPGCDGWELDIDALWKRVDDAAELSDD